MGLLHWDTTLAHQLSSHLKIPNLKDALADSQKKMDNMRFVFRSELNLNSRFIGSTDQTVRVSETERGHTDRVQEVDISHSQNSLATGRAVLHFGDRYLVRCSPTQYFALYDHRLFFRKSYFFWGYRTSLLYFYCCKPTRMDLVTQGKYNDRMGITCELVPA